MSEIKDILSKHKTIAMIGVSKDPKKPSTIVMKYMQKYGFKVIPVNPRAKGEKILGEEVFEKITDIKEPVGIVDVFRPSKEAYAIAEDTVKIGAIKTIVSHSSILLRWFKTSSPGSSPAKTGLNFSLYKSTESTLLPFSCAVLIKVSLIAALKDASS